jgi:hypothetical protein
MHPLTESIWKQKTPGGLFSDTAINLLYPDRSVAAKRAMVNKAHARGEIERLRPGLYYLSKEYQSAPLHLFAVAEAIYYPSYVTAESALRYHGLIPEATFGVVSAIMSRSRVYETPLGRFEYRRIVCRNFLAGVEWIEIEHGCWAALASPLRAIADLVYWRTDASSSRSPEDFLIESMRIEPEDVYDMNFEGFDDVLETFTNARVRRFLRNLKKAR